MSAPADRREQSAAIRALTGDPEVRLRGDRLYRGRRPLPVAAPLLHADDLGSFRGAADGMAMRLVHSDGDLHRRLRPADPAERLVFDLLEQFRVESLAHLPGVVYNLRHRFRHWSLGFHGAGNAGTATGDLLFTVVQVTRSRITGEPIPAEVEDVIEATRFRLASTLGHDLLGLRRSRGDQRRYADHALAIAQLVGELLVVAPDDDAEDTADRFALFLDPGDGQEDAVQPAGVEPAARLRGTEREYRAFTTAYDRVHNVSALIRPALLAGLRERLDRRIAAAGINIARLTRALRHVVADPASTGWDAGQEEGHLDGRRLAQLVTSPGERRLFRAERIEPVANCVVTLLIDCSGSMKQHADDVAVIADVLARALELAGASCEILGFTTGAWNGGRVLRDWRRAGRPRHPGRLSEVCHLVFKDTDTSYRRARPGIAGLLKADLYREGVDGEALAWAGNRLLGRDEARRLLLVLSDGSPMDSATQLTNGPRYLDEHLLEVVQRLGASVQVSGVGVGLDPSDYYRSSLALDLSRGAGNAVLADVVRLLGR